MKSSRSWHLIQTKSRVQYSLSCAVHAFVSVSAPRDLFQREDFWPLPTSAHCSAQLQPAATSNEIHQRCARIGKAIQSMVWLTTTFSFNKIKIQKTVSKRNWTSSTNWSKRNFTEMTQFTRWKTDPDNTLSSLVNKTELLGHLPLESVNTFYQLVFFIFHWSNILFDVCSAEATVF